MSSKKRQRIRRRRTRRARNIIRFFVGGDDTKCLFVRFPVVPGLGNQLYAYAAAIGVKNKTGLDMCILPTNNPYSATSTNNPHSTTDYRTILFKQGRPVEAANVKNRVNVAKKVLGGISNTHNDWSEMPINANKSGNAVIGDSYFQNYNGIKDVIPIIRKDCKEVFEDRYKGFKDTIAPTSAFIHVRRGNYSDQWSLGAEYYSQGLAMLDAVPEITAIYMLSDDIGWCKQQGFSSSKLKWFDDPKESADELKALYLMSLCLGGACISASTFSTWGAILGADQNEKSTIIYPKRWAISGSNSSAQKFPARWKAI
jgi:hypothetical protein